MLDRADDETLARRNALARDVRDELAAVGLPVIPDHELTSSMLATGAVVHVDPFADSGGGVYVSWQPHRVLIAAANDALTMGRQVDANGQVEPAINLAGTTRRAMQDAIAEILTVAGYEIVKDANDMAPFDLEVLSWRGESAWRDWLFRRQA